MKLVCRIIVLISMTFLFACKNDNSLKLLAAKSQNNEPVENNFDCAKIEYDSLEDAINNKECVKRLYLRNQNYEYIPSEVFAFENLEFLDVSANLIQTIPEQISQLKKLKDLRLAYNVIYSINASIAELQNLEHLSLLDNNIDSVPTFFCELKKLKKINLTLNKFRDIPDCIITLPNIKLLALESEYLNISEQRIKELTTLNTSCDIMY